MLNVLNVVWVECFLHGSWTGWSGNHRIGWMAKPQSVCQKLVTQKLEVIVHWKHLAFWVQMLDGGHLVASSGYAESVVLHHLKLLDGSLAGVWIPDLAGVVQQRPDEAAIGPKESLLILAPSRARQSLEDLEPSWCPGFEIVSVGWEVQECVQNDT
jgi:hypothetical protein